MIKGEMRLRQKKELGKDKEEEEETKEVSQEDKEPQVKDEEVINQEPDSDNAGVVFKKWKMKEESD